MLTCLSEFVEIPPTLTPDILLSVCMGRGVCVLYCVVCVRVSECACARVRARVRACVRACVCVSHVETILETKH